MKKMLTAFLAASLILVNTYAQDEWGDSGDSWGDSSSSGSESSSEKSFWDRFSLTGDADLAGRIYLDSDTAEKAEVKVLPGLKLGLDYEGDSTKFSGKINLTEDVIRFHPVDVLDEFSADLFVGDFVLSAGKMRVVWGKGDKLHVLDNFNANDYTNFIIPDYLDRRTADYMFRLQYNSPVGFRLEGIYTPVMTAERYASKGRWVPGQMNKLTAGVKAKAETQLGGKMVAKDNAFATLTAAAAAYKTSPTDSTKADAYVTAAAAYSQAADDYLKALTNASSIDADSLLPNTNSLEYGQFGVYGNFPIGPVDVGVSYYNGHYKKVSVNQSVLAGFDLSNTATLNGAVTYDKLQVFGLDAQSAIGPFTVRAELGYNLTKDTDGDNPWVHNNSICYLAGFDVGLPIHNLNLNIQEYGTVILNKDKITDSPTKLLDVDYDPTGCYSNNKIVVQLKDTFYYEKIEAVVKAIYGFERKDLVLMPEVSYKIRDGWKGTLSGMYIHNFGDDEDSEFNGWLDNSFVQLAVHYSF